MEISLAILGWLMICGILFGENSSNPIYYHYLKGEMYFCLLDFWLLFLMPFYLCYKIVLDTYIFNIGIRKSKIMIIVMHLFISSLLSVHLLYWFYYILLCIIYTRIYNVGIIIYATIALSYILISLITLKTALKVIR